MTNTNRYTDGMKADDLADVFMAQIDSNPALRAALEARLANPSHKASPAAQDSATARINTGSHSTGPTR